MIETAKQRMLTTEVRLSLPEWVIEVCNPSDRFVTDVDKMRLAIALSRENVRRGTGGPFGAAVFKATDHSLVSVGVNVVELLRNSAMHAEVFALMLAEQSMNSHTLKLRSAPPFELFTSCAPCAMCLGAILWSGVRRVVCGARREDAMRIGFDEGPVFPESIKYLEDRGIRIVNEVLATEAVEILELYRSQKGSIYNP